MRTVYKRISLGVTAAALLALQVAPPAIAAYNFPATIGQFTGDMTTATANSYATTVSKFNGGTSFGSMAGQAAGSVAVTGGTINGTAIGGTTPAAVTGTAITGTSLSAGTGNVTGGAGNFSGPITSVGQVVAYRALTSGTTTALVASDQFVCINKTTGSATTVTQTALTVGQVFHLKDCKGDASTNNITYTPGSGITVDGQSSLVLNNPYQEINLLVTSATTVSVF